MESYRPKKNLALVLSGGSARGMAHIGVIEVLEEHKIPIEAIVGTSVGALIGGVYLSGALNELKNTLLKFTPADVARLFISKPKKEGLTDGFAVSTILKKMIRNKRIEDLPIPLLIVSADLRTGEGVVKDTGDLLTAIRASISIPGLFVPVHDKDLVLVDGSIVDPVPIDIGRKVANKLIVVDVVPTAHNFQREKEAEIIEIIEDSINLMEEKLAKMVHKKRKKEEVIIKPDVSSIYSLQFHKAKEAIEAGRNAAIKALPQIKRLIKAD